MKYALLPLLLLVFGSATLMAKEYDNCQFQSIIHTSPSALDKYYQLMDQDLDGIPDVDDFDDDNDGILDIDESIVAFTETCNIAFYQVIDNELNVLDPTTGNYLPIGQPANFSYNATAHYPVDGFLYGIARQNTGLDADGATVNPGDLIKVDPFNGEVFFVSTTGLSDTKFSGFIEGDFMYVLPGENGSTSFDRIDLTDNSVITLDCTSNFLGPDLVVFGDELYTVDANGDILTVDLTATPPLTVNTKAVTDLPDASFGAMYVADITRFFVSDNAGALYEITGYDTPSPAAIFIQNTEPTNSNDGASCFEAPFPTGAVDTDMDGLIDALDTDSDGDNCDDVIEAGFTDADGDGEVDGTGVTASGTVIDSDGYSGSNSSVTIVGPDADMDGIADACDPFFDLADNDDDGVPDEDDVDDDNDGILDIDESVVSVSETCNIAFYQVIADQLNILDPVSGNYLPIGVPANFPYNATAHYTGDGFIYGIARVSSGLDANGAMVNPGDLIKVEPFSGEVFFAATTGLSDNKIGGFIMGDFLYVVPGENGTASVDQVDLASGAVTTIDCSTNFLGPDIIGFGDKLYTVNNSGKLLSVDITDPQPLQVNNQTVTGLPAGAYGAMYMAEDDRFFVSNNAGGLYEIADYNTIAPFSNFLQVTQATSSNDGASCVQAPFPTGVADTDNDGTIDSMDEDSDGDNCNDVIEAGFTDNDGDGEVDGTGINPDGSVMSSDGYTGSNSSVTIVGPDIDSDGIADACDPINNLLDKDDDGVPDEVDLDDDNDGILDVDESIASFSENCNIAFYQVIADQLNVLDPGTGNYLPIGQPANFPYNATAHYPVDGFIYGIARATSGMDAVGVMVNPGDLIRVDPFTGEVFFVSTTGLTDNKTAGFVEGDFLYVLPGENGPTSFDRVNLTDNTVSTIDCDISFNGPDMVAFGNFLYTVDASGNLLSVDYTATPPLTVNSAPVSGLPASSYGAMYVADNTRFFVSDNDGGLYEILDYTSATPTSSFLQDTQATSSNDGASCFEAPFPTGAVDTDNDGDIDACDTDADGDGCDDAIEAGFTDADGDGEVDGTGVNPDGTIMDSDGYTGSNSTVTIIGPDADMDGVPDACDNDCLITDPLQDCDGDGIANGDENPGEELDPCSDATHPDWVALATNDCDDDGTTVGEGDADDFDPCVDFDAINPTVSWAAGDCDGDGILNGDENPGEELDPCADTSHPDWVAPMTNDCDDDGATVGDGDSDDFDPCVDFDSANPGSGWLNADCDGDGILNGDENPGEEFNPCADASHPDWVALPTNDCDDDGTTVGEGDSDDFNPCVDYDFTDQTATWAAADCDGDGIANGDENPGEELNPCSDASHPDWISQSSNDCDGDGTSIGEGDTDDADPCVDFTAAEADTAWQNLDCDGDGILNGDENPGEVLDPCADPSNSDWVALGSNDCDDDGTTVAEGDSNDFDPCIDYNITNQTASWAAGDCDGDGILNGDENPEEELNPCADPSNPNWVAQDSNDCDQDGVTVGAGDPDDWDPCVPDENATDIVCSCELFVPDAFSPNNDGQNEKFVITCLESYPDNVLTIFNRWGNKVYEDSYRSQENEWDGTNSMGNGALGGDELPDGTYFYVIELNDAAGSDPLKGFIFLQR